MGRYLLTSGHEDGSVSGFLWYPIGLLGQADADWQASRDQSTSCVVPWHGEPIPKMDELPPGAWLVSHGAGSLAFALSATVGYNLNFLPNPQFPGFGRLLNSRIAAVVKPLLGCKINDEYVVVLNRESDEPKVRLRIFRSFQQKTHAGVDLSVGIPPGQPVPPIAGLAEAMGDFAAMASLQPQIALQVAAAIPQLMRSNLAAAYERSTQDTALLDVTFDFQQEAAKTLFQNIIAGGALDGVFRDILPGVQVHEAVLTHGITRSLQVQIHFPFFEAAPKNLRQTLATLHVEENAGRVLVYSLQSSDQASSSRFRSELALLGQITVENGKLNLDGLADATVAYRTRQAGSGILAEYDAELPGTIIAEWLRPRSKEELSQAAQRVSVALQTQLKLLLQQLYFSERSHLQQNATTAALLVWAAFPASTKIYWDWRSPNLRDAMLRDPRTIANLTQLLGQWRLAADEHQASFFETGQISAFLQLTAKGQGNELLQSLLFTESQLVWGAKKALDKLKDVCQDAPNAPTKALHALAAFGDQVSGTFHRNLSVYCSTPTLRSLNSLLFVEATRALGENGGTFPSEQR